MGSMLNVRAVRGSMRKTHRVWQVKDARETRLGTWHVNRSCQLQVLDTATQWRKIHTQFVLYSLRLTRYSGTTEYVFSSDESGKPTLGQSHLHFFRWRAIAAPVPSWKSFEEKFVFMPFANALQKKYPGPFTRNRRVCIFAYQLSVHFCWGDPLYQWCWGGHFWPRSNLFLWPREY